MLRWASYIHMQRFIIYKSKYITSFSSIREFSWNMYWILWLSFDMIFNIACSYKIDSMRVWIIIIEPPSMFLQTCFKIQNKSSKDIQIYKTSSKWISKLIKFNLMKNASPACILKWFISHIFIFSSGLIRSDKKIVAIKYENT